MKSQHLIIILIICAVLSSASASKLEIAFQINHIHGLYNFVETISGGQHRSATLREYFEKSSYHTDKFKSLLAEFAAISDLDSLGYSFHGYPKGRAAGQTVDQIFIIQSAYAKNLKDFSQRTAGLLPLSTHKRLFEILKEFEHVYDALIWNSNLPKMQTHLKELKALSNRVQMEKMFEKAATLYKAQWPADTPFLISLYPIPAKSGFSSAEASGTVESVGVLTDSADYSGKFGVIFHEMCHSLYVSESVDTQKSIDAYFRNSTSPYALDAYRFFNEAMATAMGNGWATALALGHAEVKAWYNDRYINPYARAIYPTVLEYLKNNQSIDDSFVNRIIADFQKTLPGILYEYQNLLSHVLLVAERKDIEPELIRSALKRYYKVSSYNFSSPIEHEMTFKEIRDADDTVLVVLTPHAMNQLKNFMENFEIFKKSKDVLLSTKANYVFGAKDKDRRVYLIMKVAKAEDLPKAFETLTLKKELNLDSPLTTF